MLGYSEYNFDGIVGPTHHYGGLSVGNLASTRHAGITGNPRAAALEGLEKMRFVASLGIGQAVLPPGARPLVSLLARLGYRGSLAETLSRAFREAPGLVSRLFSASSMWTANAATVFPSCDTEDKRLHLLTANLSSMAHRSMEVGDTLRVLRRIFASPAHFQVHAPLPHYLPDEGAANHLRLATRTGATHLLAWGKSFGSAREPQRFIARQSLEASQAAPRLATLPSDRALFWQQHPDGIDAGAFHSDVLALSNAHVLLLHEQAFVDHTQLLSSLSKRLGPEFTYCVATQQELGTREAVDSYPFNSQLVTLPDGSMAIIAPREAESAPAAHRYLQRAVAEVGAISALHFIDVNSSMRNGGGPACLRLRVLLSDSERQAITARVFWDDALYHDLKTWIVTHYRTELTLDDLKDPDLVTESYRALDELTQLLQLGSIYEFQGALMNHDDPEGPH